MKCSLGVIPLVVVLVLVMDFHSLTEGATHATLTLNGFAKGEDGGGKSECDNQWHEDDTLVVALSTHWFHGMCGKKIAIHGNDHTVVAKVVDECDQGRGCDDDIVDGSEEVWKKLGVKKGSGKWGQMPVTWEHA